MIFIYRNVKRAFFNSAMMILPLIVLLAAPLAQVFASEEKKFLVGFAQDDLAQTWRKKQVLDLKKSLQKYPNVEFIYTDAQGKIPNVIRNVEDLHERGIDLLVISPPHPTLLNNVLAKVYKDGIPIVLITRQIKGDTYTTTIGPDDFDIGARAAHKLAQSMNEKGSVLIVEGLPTATTAIERTAGFLKEIKKYKNITIASIIQGNYRRRDAIKAVSQILEDDVSFDGIYSHSDNMALGLEIAFKAFSFDATDIPLITIDYTHSSQVAIRSGRQVASFTYPNSAAEVSDIIWKILNGKAVSREVVVPSIMVTKDNVNDIEPAF